MHYDFTNLFCLKVKFIYFWKSTSVFHSDTEIMHESWVDTICPSMESEILSSIPCCLYDTRFGERRYLLADIYLDESIDTRCFIMTISECISMEMVSIFYMRNPVIDDTIRFSGKCCLDASTAIVSTDDDVWDTEYIYSIVENWEHIHITRYHHICDVSVYENFTWLCSYDFVRRNSTVGATDPEKWWSLSMCKFFEKFRIILEVFCDPRFIIFENSRIEIHTVLSYDTRTTWLHTSIADTR